MAWWFCAVEMCLTVAAVLWWVLNSQHLLALQLYYTHVWGNKHNLQRELTPDCSLQVALRPILLILLKQGVV